MEPLQFNDQNNMSQQNFRMNSMQPQSGFITNMFIKMGLAKDVDSANKVMVTVSVVFLIISFVIIFKTL